MYQVNDVIVYGVQGVCKIVDTEEKTFNGVRKAYYVLKPVKDPGSTIFAPMDNGQVLKKMRKLLSEEEIHRLIDSMKKETPEWNPNEAERRAYYKDVIVGGNHLELIRMIKAIYTYKQEREACGKHLHMADERIFKDAEQVLYNEFQYVLNLSTKEALMEYILNRVNDGAQ